MRTWTPIVAVALSELSWPWCVLRVWESSTAKGSSMTGWRASPLWEQLWQQWWEQ